MGIKILSEIEIEGTRSFAGRSTIKLPYPGMVLINGAWTGGGISSGAGKSTIPIAVAHVLDCCDIPATVLKSRYGGKQHVRIRLRDSETGEESDIIRNPKLKIGDKTGKAAEDKFNEILKAPSDLIKALTYRPQREKGQFLTRTDSQNKEFLSALLNLSSLEGGSDDLSKEKDRFNIETTTISSQIQSAEANMTALANAKAQIPDAEARYVEAQKRYNLVAGTDGRAAIQHRIASLQSEISRINQTSMQANTAQAENKSLRERIVATQEHLEKSSGSICPTCNRDGWGNSQSHYDMLKEQVQGMLKRMEGNLTIINSAAPMLAALPGLQADLAAENRKLGEAQAPIADAFSSMDAAKRLLEQLHSQARYYDQIAADVDKKKARIEELKVESEITRHASALLSRDGFLSVIFDGVLKEIETKANLMIGQIPNVASFSIQVVSSHETQKGTTKKTISVKIFKDGEELPFKSLSGGQQCALELFTDLAVSETVRKRSGSPVGWMFLDEAMDGLDVETKKVALAVIRRNVSGTVIVIDHSTEIKESFDQVINVEFDGRCSRVSG